MKNTVFILLLMSSLSYSQQWHFSLEEAKLKAKEVHQNIILVFSGSDWCAPCIKLEHDVFNTKEFQDYSNAHYVLLKADFPRRKKNALSKEQQEQNNRLAEKYNQNGYFPLVVVLDKDGNVLGETGYRKTTPQDFINLLNSF